MRVDSLATMSRVLCVDVGSTFTKAVVVETGTGELLARAETPTTVGTDVLDGYRTVRDLAEAQLPDGSRCPRPRSAPPVS